MRLLKILQKMWLVAMIALLLFSGYKFFKIGFDYGLVSPLVGAFLCFFVYWNLGNMIKFKEKNEG